MSCKVTTSFCYTIIIHSELTLGHLGKLSISLHWLNLGNQPAKILVEDVYLLVVPSSQTADDPEEEENRVQAAKAERLENAELLHMRDPQAETGTSCPLET